MTRTHKSSHAANKHVTAVLVHGALVDASGWPVVFEHPSQPGDIAAIIKTEAETDKLQS